MTQELQAELHQGVLVRFFGGFYVAADADGQEYTLRCPKKFRHQRLSPLVGDQKSLHPTTKPWKAYHKVHGRLLQSMRRNLYLVEYKLYFIVCDLYLTK